MIGVFDDLYWSDSVCRRETNVLRGSLRGGDARKSVFLPAPVFTLRRRGVAPFRITFLVTVWRERDGENASRN
jgi:hypothetical protein